MAGAKSSDKRGPGLAVKVWLFSYNFLQVLGWSYLLYQLVNYYTNPPASKAPLWDIVKLGVIVFQNAAFLEVINVGLGFVKSNLIITFFQVMSRLIVVDGLLIVTPTAPESIGLPLCILCWSIAEITRYLYYALNIIDAVPYALVWCRYTFFWVLYPVGITGELLCYYAAQSYVQEHNLFSLSLPNKLNIAFSYHYFLIFMMLLYIPLFPQMFMHMVHQRRKIIGGGGAAKSEASAKGKKGR
ncbi:unnamed protein product [Bemisia tabaci]|uniref:Very-long-chain (3R)-3-hydroxyacyl-CoA dehydratase n=1 Tax=Bemisia tabaci TaxID=7038 RepID=A0A9P0F850_BEMTA|nr:PREDICTED: very-long-chain (3R)-3-hydroxyacyl-CoA dehydratase hpo-8-like [Bemisia tabaci]CAH0393162.1 unnamed protein product [Bemisia tabaci]